MVQQIPDPEAFMNAALARGKEIIQFGIMATETGNIFDEDELELMEAGIAAGITAAIEELDHLQMLALPPKD